MQVIKSLDNAISCCPTSIHGGHLPGLSEVLILLSEAYSKLGRQKEAMHSGRLAVTCAHRRTALISSNAAGKQRSSKGICPLLDDSTTLLTSYYNLATLLECNSSSEHLALQWYSRVISAADEIFSSLIDDNSQSSTTTCPRSTTFEKSAIMKKQLADLKFRAAEAALRLQLKPHLLEITVTQQISPLNVTLQLCDIKKNSPQYAGKAESLKNFFDDDDHTIIDSYTQKGSVDIYHVDSLCSAGVKSQEQHPCRTHNKRPDLFEETRSHPACTSLSSTSTAMPPLVARINEFPLDNGNFRGPHHSDIDLYTLKTIDSPRSQTVEGNYGNLPMKSHRMEDLSSFFARTSGAEFSMRKIDQAERRKSSLKPDASSSASSLSRIHSDLSYIATASSIKSMRDSNKTIDMFVPTTPLRRRQIRNDKKKAAEAMIRVNADRKRKEVERAVAATKLQRLYRGYIARLWVQAIRRQHIFECNRRNRKTSALIIQRVYRGHYSRICFRRYLHDLNCVRVSHHRLRSQACSTTHSNISASPIEDWTFPLNEWNEQSCSRNILTVSKLLVKDREDTLRSACAPDSLNGVLQEERALVAEARSIMDVEVEAKAGEEKIYQLDSFCTSECYIKIRVDSSKDVFNESLVHNKNNSSGNEIQERRSHQGPIPNLAIAEEMPLTEEVDIHFHGTIRRAMVDHLSNIQRGHPPCILGWQNKSIKPNVTVCGCSLQKLEIILDNASVEKPVTVLENQLGIGSSSVPISSVSGISSVKSTLITGSMDLSAGDPLFCGCEFTDIEQTNEDVLHQVPDMMKLEDGKVSNSSSPVNGFQVEGKLSARQRSEIWRLEKVHTSCSLDINHSANLMQPVADPEDVQSRCSAELILVKNPAKRSRSETDKVKKNSSHSSIIPQIKYSRTSLSSAPVSFPVLPIKSPTTDVNCSQSGVFTVTSASMRQSNNEDMNSCVTRVMSNILTKQVAMDWVARNRHAVKLQSLVRSHLERCRHRGLLNLLRRSCILRKRENEITNREKMMGDFFESLMSTSKQNAGDLVKYPENQDDTVGLQQLNSNNTTAALIQIYPESQLIADSDVQSLKSIQIVTLPQGVEPETVFMMNKSHIESSTGLPWICEDQKMLTVTKALGPPLAADQVLWLAPLVETKEIMKVASESLLDESSRVGVTGQSFSLRCRPEPNMNPQSAQEISIVLTTPIKVNATPVEVMAGSDLKHQLKQDEGQLVELLSMLSSRDEAQEISTEMTSDRGPGSDIKHQLKQDEDQLVDLLSMLSSREKIEGLGSVGNGVDFIF